MIWYTCNQAGIHQRPSHEYQNRSPSSSPHGSFPFARTLSESRKMEKKKSNLRININKNNNENDKNDHKQTTSQAQQTTHVDDNNN